MVVWFRKLIPLAAVLSLLMGVSVPGQALSSEASKVAENAPVLRVLKKCPLTEPTCVVFDIGLVWEGERFVDADRHPSVVSVALDESTGYADTIVQVRGRLNGGPEIVHQIVFHPYVDGLYCRDFTGAIVGVSGETGGTVLTDAGRLEITDGVLTFGDRYSLHLIEDKTLSVTRHLSSGWESYTWKGKPVISPEGRVMWEVRGQCLDYESGKLFQIVPKGECRGNELVKATDAEIGRVREGRVFSEPFANERLKYDLWRLKDSSFLVWLLGVACT